MLNWARMAGFSAVLATAFGVSLVWAFGDSFLDSTECQNNTEQHQTKTGEQHMLRHACGYALANKGHDTRALQAYLGHKNIQHTVRYTELSPARFKDFWR
jgi:hypothetical protein